MILGDALHELRALDANSIDSVITDPPYGLAFMNKHWDYEVPSIDIWREVFRVLKPGGHLLSFGGTRTYHRMVVNIEDAGFEIRDQIQWLYGQGFPKSLDISKAIDKAAGAEREVVGISNVHGGGNPVSGSLENPLGRDSELPITAPATDAAKQWSGWGTALKPANEPIVLARKPISEKTVAANVLKWGTGGLNIDAGRIGTEENLNGGTYSKGAMAAPRKSQVPGNGISRDFVQPSGRFPANVILDEVAGEMLDAQTGELKAGVAVKHNSGGKNIFSETKKPTAEDVGYGGSGGASRFFYCAKASKSERNKGLEGLITWENADLNSLMGELNQLARDISADTMQVLEGTSWSTGLYGHSIAEQYPPGLMCTISTAIKLITELKTSPYSQNSNTKENILGAIRTIEVNGLSLAESAAFLSRLDLTTTDEETALVLGVSRAAFQTLSQIRGFAKPGNIHSTVKPVALMEYLIKLITPPMGVVLDPFMGSGTTGVACKRLGFNFTGIELNDEYFQIAKRRIEAAAFVPPVENAQLEIPT